MSSYYIYNGIVGAGGERYKSIVSEEEQTKGIYK